MNRLIPILIGLVCAVGAHAGPVFSGFLNDPANTALRASDLTAPLFGSDLEIASNVARSMNFPSAWRDRSGS